MHRRTNNQLLFPFLNDARLEAKSIGLPCGTSRYTLPGEFYSFSFLLFVPIKTPDQRKLPKTKASVNDPVGDAKLVFAQNKELHEVIARLRLQVEELEESVSPF